MTLRLSCANCAGETIRHTPYGLHIGDDMTQYNVRVNVIELIEFVFSMYAEAEISEGKASKLLGIDRLEFREQYRQWENEEGEEDE